MINPKIQKRKKYRIAEVLSDGKYKVVYTTSDERFAYSQLEKFRMFYPNKKFTKI